MKKKALVVLVFVLIIFVVYFIWYLSGRQISAKPTLAHPLDISNFGSDSGCGNIVAVQPLLLNSDYATEERFYAVLDSYFAIAQQRGWLTPKTIVALPEFLGTWIIATGEKEAVYTAPNLTEAMKPVILCHVFSFIKEYIPAYTSKIAKDFLTYTIFKMKAKKAARIYQSIFSRLAKHYGVTVVAGSIILPSPRINQGRLEIGKGKLYNVTVVYKPDGRAYDNLVRKAYPTGLELTFIASGSASEIPVFETPAGRLGVLVCADAWYPDPYIYLKKKNVDMIVVPSHKALSSKLVNPWGGYDGMQAPGDIDPADVKKITEENALHKYAMLGRISTSGAKYGVDVFIRGDFWGIGSDGYTMIMNRGEILKGKFVNGSTLTNLWLK